MKGRTVTIGIIAITIIVVAVIIWLMLATFKQDEQKNGPAAAGYTAESVYVIQ
ncbi:hypothetical protein [Sporosarcina trichiuri]|uniref:hypothetical protein n=1 Tax=Sporosarcina trichiuri TaxID=3056445 RepID=UPI0025B53BC3|nr:hypothetical protein [Sporosarcina sp. 0.2-SM1T-5]WJY27091.1 hypothetical protein QWT68_13735 [Sporosarcina sp. 0.2-SM1T-5]